MEKMPSVEQPVTPEKTREELYFETLKAKRDVLSSHYTLNQLRRGKKIETMSEAEIEDYKSVKNEYDKRRELFLALFDNLNEAGGQKVSELTSLTKVEIELSKLEKPAEADIEVKPTEGVKPEDFDIVSETRIHRGESIVAKPRVERPSRDMTLEEIDQKIAFAQRQTLGLKRESAEYWEAEKALLLERQEAETNPDRPTPRGFMQRTKDAFARVKDALTDRFAGANAISGGQETVESRMSPLGLRVETTEPVNQGEPVNPTEPEIVQPEPVQPEPTTQQAEKEPKKPSAWGWLKERGKGVWNFGIWEFHQAERFRSKTKEAANDTKTLATLIQQERNLNLEEAETEAWETVEELKKNKLTIDSASEFYQANRDVIDRKRKKNDQEIEYIIASSSNDLLDKLQKYRGEAGQDVLTQENKLAFQADLRGELNKMRDGASRKDFVNFAKLMRRNLDENWHWRYVWGAAEAALGFIGVKFLIAAVEKAALAKLLAAEKAASGAGGAAGSGVEQFVTQTMHDNVWTTLKEMAQNGPQHLNLDDTTLQELSQKVLDSNNMYEQEWVSQIAEDLRSSRTLPGGMPIKIPVEVLKVLGY